jgi:PAS domain-containing protein
VQEGIIVDANPSWLELFGIVAADGLVGQPIMDLFEESKHAALKGALAADARLLERSHAAAQRSAVRRHRLPSRWCSRPANTT